MLRPLRHPVVMTGLGVRALWPAKALAGRLFEGDEARGLFGGLAAHTILDLGKPLTSSFGLTFAASGHAVAGGGPGAGGDPSASPTPWSPTSAP